MTPENGTRCLITGGAGFIGSNVTAALLAAGHEVTVLDDLSSGFRKNLQADPRLTFVEGDVRDGKAVHRAIEGAASVFHLAASVGNKRSIDDPFHNAEVNVLGTLNSLEEVRRAGVGRLVVSSSVGVFGELKTLSIREDHPVEPDTPYGSTKLCAEKLSLSFAKLYGFGVVCLRYFNVYGPNQRFDAYGNVIPIFVFQALRGEPLTIFGDGEQTRGFVHVRDVAAANVWAAARSGLSFRRNFVVSYAPAGRRAAGLRATGGRDEGSGRRRCGIYRWGGDRFPDEDVARGPRLRRPPLRGDVPEAGPVRLRRHPRP